MAEAPFLASVEATLGKIVFGDLFLKHNFVHSNKIWHHADSNDDQLVNVPEDVGDVVMVGVGRQDDGDDVERSSPEGVEEAPIGGGAFLGEVDQAEIYKGLSFFFLGRFQITGK